MKLSVVLAVYNEEANIGSCLESVKTIADEIVIVDGQSSDKTVEIAKKYKTRIISVPNNPHFHSMKDLAIKEAAADWILQLDADEQVSKELAQEISHELTHNKKYNGYGIPRRNWFLGRFLSKGGAYPDYCIRLFKKGKGHIQTQTVITNGITTTNVHAQIAIDGEIGYLSHDLIHNGDPSLSKYLARFDRYTSLEAGNLIELGLKPSFIQALNYVVFKPSYWFCKRYFRHRGYVDGYQGFLFALLSALHYPVIYLKIGEKAVNAQQQTR